LPERSIALIVTSLYSDLSKNDLVLMMEVIDGALGVRTLDELKSLTLALQSLFDFDYAFIGLGYFDQVATQRKPSVELLDINYPKGVLENYFAEGFNLKDPVVMECLRTLEVQNWMECFGRYNAAEVLSDMNDNGMVDGYSHALFSPSSLQASSFSFGCARHGDVHRAKFILGRIVPHLAQAAVRCLGREGVNRIFLRKLLTEREMEVLRWMKEGKTAWEISMILSISERTANFHVGNITRKLGASNRSHAVAIACSMGITNL
jgi:DNA-binding CsgD family transcriptional regulator